MQKTIFSNNVYINGTCVGSGDANCSQPKQTLLQYLVLRDDAIAECHSIFVQLTVAADQHRKRVLESN